MESDECPESLVRHLEFFGYYRERITCSPGNLRTLLTEWKSDLDQYQIKPSNCPISIYTVKMPTEIMLGLLEFGYDPYKPTINGYATHQELTHVSQWINLLTLGYNLFTLGHDRVIQEEVPVGFNMPPRLGHNHYTYLTEVSLYTDLVASKINLTTALVSLVLIIITSTNPSVQDQQHLVKLVPWAIHYSVGRALGSTLLSFDALKPYIKWLRSLRSASTLQSIDLSMCPVCSQLLLTLQLALIRSRQWHTICQEIQCLPPRGSFPGGSHYHGAQAHFITSLV
jgi:hypothetical protein